MKDKAKEDYAGNSDKEVIYKAYGKLTEDKMIKVDIKGMMSR
jgi:hypothetical protein